MSPHAIRFRIPAQCTSCAAKGSVVAETMIQGESVMLTWLCRTCDHEWPITAEEQQVEQRKIPKRKSSPDLDRVDRRPLETSLLMRLCFENGPPCSPADRQVSPRRRRLSRNSSSGFRSISAPPPTRERRRTLLPARRLLAPMQPSPFRVLILHTGAVCRLKCHSVRKIVDESATARHQIARKGRL